MSCEKEGGVVKSATTDNLHCGDNDANIKGNPMYPEVTLNTSLVFRQKGEGKNP